jgi:aminoglycoside phosphotransferase family enzyme/predicted kinase
MDVRRLAMGAIEQDLLLPAAYPSPAPREVRRIDTHISWVFLAGDRAFKVKRPVRFPFLDFQAREARLLACREEVRCNARLAPGVYRGVVPVRRGLDGALRFGREGEEGRGEVVDWAVEMDRLPDALRADVRLARGGLDAEDIGRIADHLAAFHRTARADGATAAWGAPELVWRAMEENFASFGDVDASVLAPAQLVRIRDEQRRGFEACEGLLARRAEAGFVRECHGDLRLEHVYERPDGTFVVLDAIEFSESLRCVDVACDIAFLAMDLAFHGRVDLAERLLARYARASDDYDIFALVDLFIGYRACVRAKIALAMARDAALPEEARATHLAEARRYLLLAVAETRRPVIAPSVTAVGGLIATGKSTVADALGLALGAPVVDADRARKSLLGVAPTQPLTEAPFQGSYGRGVTDAVYAEMLRRARVVLTSGRPVVLDASFRSRELRREARAIAAQHGAPFRFVECRAPRATCLERLERRARAPSVSDGRAAIADAFAASWEPVVWLSGNEHLVVDTSRPEADTQRSLRAWLDTWPRGLVA